MTTVMFGRSTAWINTLIDEQHKHCSIQANGWKRKVSDIHSIQTLLEDHK